MLSSTPRQDSLLYDGEAKKIFGLEKSRMHGQVSQDSWLTPDGCTWSGERLTRKQSTSRPANDGQISRNTCMMYRNAKQSKNGSSRNQSFITPEGCVVFSVSILMMKHSVVQRSLHFCFSLSSVAMLVFDPRFPILLSIATFASGIIMA